MNLLENSKREDIGFDFPAIEINGIQYFVYGHGPVEDIVKEVKHHDHDSIKLMADFLTGQIAEQCAYLVPAPQHTGAAEYTLEMCQDMVEMAKEADKVLIIADILKCTPREMLYDQKWKQGKTVGNLETGFYLDGDIPIGYPIYFVDNVIGTGTTFFDACKLVPNMKPLAFAIGKQSIDKLSFDGSYKLI